MPPDSYAPPRCHAPPEGGQGPALSNRTPLSQEGLFRQLPQTAPNWPDTHAADPEALHGHWQQITGNSEPALATPYLNHSAVLPATKPSVVVRVITAQAGPNKRIEVAHAWLEVPLSSGVVIFIDKDGLVLPKPGKQLPFEHSQELQQWQRLVRNV